MKTQLLRESVEVLNQNYVLNHTFCGYSIMCERDVAEGLVSGK